MQFIILLNYNSIIFYILIKNVNQFNESIRLFKKLVVLFNRNIFFNKS